MKHLDLFSGIGGFAYAVDQVWDNAEHIFCDNDKFCQQVLKKHWPKARIYGDIRDITNTTSDGCNGGSTLEQGRQDKATKVGSVEKNKPFGERWEREFGEIDLLTGGFPCQPFSQAGKRRGRDDDRYLWPEMLKVIQLCKPRWVIAENVRGLLTLEGGLVFEQVCIDLEASGYEVQPFGIPAVAVNAPHRRDRVWFVAYCKSGKSRKQTKQEGWQDTSRGDSNAQNTHSERRSGRSKNRRQILERQSSQIETTRPDSQVGDVTDTKRSGEQRFDGGQRQEQFRRSDWEQNWFEVATELCRVDDGLSKGLDFTGWSEARHRVERLKSLGNAIVPQVAIEIMKTLKKGV